MHIKNLYINSKSYQQRKYYVKPTNSLFNITPTYHCWNLLCYVVRYITYANWMVFIAFAFKNRLIYIKMNTFARRCDFYGPTSYFNQYINNLRWSKCQDYFDNTLGSYPLADISRLGHINCVWSYDEQHRHLVLWFVDV